MKEYSQKTSAELTEQLFEAVVNNDLKKVQDALKTQVDINAVNKEGKTILMVAIDFDVDQAIFSRLLGHKDIILNKKAYKGLTALMHAVLSPNKSKIGTLLNFGARLEEKDDEGNTALMHAVSAYIKSSNKIYNDIIQKLLDKGADINAENTLLSTPLKIAEQSCESTYKMLLNKKTSTPIKPISIFLALTNRNLKLAKKVLEDNPGCINFKSKKSGNTPIMQLMKNLLSDETTVVSSTTITILQSLIKLVLAKSPDLELADREGLTPIMVAAQLPDPKCVNMLLAHGADVTKKTPEGKTALYYAEKGSKVWKILKDAEEQLLKEPEKVKILSEDSSSKAASLYDDKGKGELDSTSSEEDSSDTSSKYSEAVSTPVVRVPKKQPAKKVSKDKATLATEQLTNLLFKAIANDNITKIKELLKDGAEIDKSRSFKKDTPLMYAAFKGKLKIVKLLVEKGANVNAIDHYNNNALHHLMRSKADNEVKVAITKFLIKQGININLIGQSDKTALDYAKKGSDVWKILKDKGATSTTTDEKYGFELQTTDKLLEEVELTGDDDSGGE